MILWIYGDWNLYLIVFNFSRSFLLLKSNRKGMAKVNRKSQILFFQLFSSSDCILIASKCKSLNFADDGQTGRPSPETGDCEEKKLACTDGTCLPSAYFCDGNVDCSDGSDERWCGKKFRSACSKRSLLFTDTRWIIQLSSHLAIYDLPTFSPFPLDKVLNFVQAAWNCNFFPPRYTKFGVWAESETCSLKLS